MCSEGEQVGELELSVRDVTEGWMYPVFGTEGGPVAEEASLGSSVLGGVSGGGFLQSKAESSCEAVAGGRCSIFQGVGCL